MRLLFVSDLYPPVAFGGYEMELAALVDGLHERHDVLVLTTGLRSDDVQPEPDVRRVLPFVERGARAALAAPRATLAAVKATEQALDEHRPDLVYVASAAAMPQAVTATVARRGLPLVMRLSELWYAEHVLTGDRFLRHLGPGDHGARAAWAQLVRLANHHPRLRFEPGQRLRAAVSWNSATLRELAGPPEVVDMVAERVIHPVSPHAEILTRLERAPAAEPLVAYLGRVTTYKGAEVAREAVAALRSDHGVIARLVYGGPVDDAMRAALAAPYVEFRGQLDSAGVARLLSEATVVIVPSLRPEAFGLSAVEAALARAPVVAADSGGIPEALRPDDHALFFPPGDAAAAATQLARAITDAAGTAARVERAFSRAREFSVESYVAESEELIAKTRSLLGASR